jgi:hypothetical protein
MRQRNEKQEAALEKRVAALMADSTWNWTRTPSARRLLVVVATAAWLVTCAIFWFAEVWGLIPLALSFALYLLLRVSVRSIADLPERFLDERQLKLRNRTYLQAYQLIGGVVSVAALALLLVQIMGDLQSRPSNQFDLTFGQLEAIVWFFFLPMLQLPSAVLGWDEASRTL